MFLIARKKFRYSAAEAGADMVQRVTTVAFEGIEIRPVDVQVQVAPGMPAFTIAWCQCQLSHGFLLCRERARICL